MKVRIAFLFAWYGLWVGVFIDTKKRTVYVFPVPMFGLKVQFEKRGTA